MSKLTQIENALRAIDGAKFQRLCDAYLYRRGYERINPLGLVAGADKVAQGTPDTLAPRPDGTYAFAEYTTRQGGLRAKFEGDLAKCFDTEKTGVPVDRIHEIVLCHNSLLSAEDEYALAEVCRRHGVNLSVYGLGPIAHDLYQKYPGLARDFLGVEVDTGQIIPPEEFVAAHSKNDFATPLDTEFRFREEELARALDALETDDLVIIAGRAGVGKTRLALEVCRRYAADHLGTRVFCVFNRGADLFQDLRVYFSAPGHYLLLVDDANRVSRFEYALQLLHDQNEEMKIKIVATARDYALDVAREAARPYGGGALFELGPLDREEIVELARNGFGIENHLYLERIAEIAQGNPRLAVMAARLARRENTLQSIADVTSLYDEYFGSIRDDLEDFRDSMLLQVAGLVSFFRAIDRSNAELMGSISDAFGLTPDVFWQAARRHHELELVDMYEDAVVRASDQVLSTYLFYLSVFRERALDLAILLEHFFPRFRHRLIDALNPVLSAFDAEEIKRRMRPTVERVWRLFEQRGDEEALLHLIDVFWFVKETDALVHVAHRIRALEGDPRPAAELRFEPSSGLPPTPSLLGVLGNFRNTEEATLRIAISLMLDYLEKRPAELPLVLRLLTERYGVTRYSSLHRYYVERNVADVVWERARGGADELASRVFLAVAEPLLHTHFQTHEPQGELSITIFNFDVPASPELSDLRRTLWRHVFALYTVAPLREHVLGLLRKHSHAGHLIANREIVAEDAEVVQPFFDSTLDPSDYRHCVVVQDYLKMLDRLGVGADEGLRARFKNETYETAQLLLDDWSERRAAGWEEYQRLKRERLSERTARLDADGFEDFLERCAEIIRAADGGTGEYQIKNSVNYALLQLAGRDGALYEAVLDRYLRAGNMLDLMPWELIAKFVEVSGPERAYEILSGADYTRRMLWLFNYFMSVAPEAATVERLRELYVLYEQAEPRDVPGDMDYLQKFSRVDEKVVVRVTRTLAARVGADARFGYTFVTSFRSNSQVGLRLREIFAGDVDLLKQAYFAACGADLHADYDGHVFDALLDLDPNFAGEWVAWMYNQKEWPSRFDDSRDYSFVWRRDDHRDVMRRVTDATVASGRLLRFSSYLEAFFVLTEGRDDVQTLRERQDAFLDELIEARHADSDLIQALFAVIANFSPDRRRARIATFLRHNRNFEDFAALSLEPSSQSWSGSAVPMLQGRAASTGDAVHGR